MEPQDSGFEFGLFDDFPEGEQHPLQIDIFGDEFDVLDRLVSTKVNIYRPLKEGTELHRAIRRGEQSRIDGLLNAYQLDFNKIRDYLALKYRWDPKDRIWLKKINLVAVDEDQCRSVKNLERECAIDDPVNLERSIFVLLQTPVDGETVAVLHPEHHNHLKLFRTIWQLFPNGYLTWNYCAGENGRRETLVELAAARGNNYTINRLYSMGAELNLPQHNPLLSACSTLRKDTIRYLLENYFDVVDFTKRRNSMNAFIILIQKNNIELLDYVLKKMLEYRQKYFHESKSQAFNSIFRYEADECTYFSILTYLKPGLVSRKLEEYIEEYELDLSYQWENVTILAELLRRKLALEYCRAGIRKHPELLGMKVLDGAIVHQCIRSEELSLLKDMYTLHPEVKTYFESESGFRCFREALDSRREGLVEFMLEYHRDFFLSDLESLQSILLNWNNTEVFWELNGALLLTHFPVLKIKIEEAVKIAHEQKICKDLLDKFKEISESLKANPLNISNHQHMLNKIRGTKGESILHYAVEEDNLPLFKLLLQAGCDLDALDSEGNHPIHSVQSVNMLDLIIKSHPAGKALVCRVNHSGCSVLQKICYCYRDHAAMLQLLKTVIDYGANVNHLSNIGESAAFLTWSDAALEILLNNNIVLDVIDNAGENVLLRHLRYQNIWVVRKLLPLFWSHPKFEDNAHKYLEPLLRTKRYAFNSAYRSLLDANPDKTRLMIDAVYNHSQEEASRLFTLACNRSRLYFVQKFLEYDYDLDYNCKDEYGSTPIMGLLDYSKEQPGDLVRQLLTKGVNLEIRDQWSETPLLMLVKRFAYVKWTGQGISTVKLLLDNGADIKTVDNCGNTVLHLAFRRSQWELIEFLIQNGADFTVKNNDGKMPYEVDTHESREIFKIIDKERLCV